MDEKAKTSQTWLHFSIVSAGSAKCNICGNKYSYKCGSTSNLKKHLQAKHPTVLLKGPSTSSAISGSAVAGPSTTTIDGSDNEDNTSVAASTLPTKSLATSVATVQSSVLSQSGAKRMKTSPSVIQTSITSHLIRPISLPKQRKINDLIVNMIVRDLQPISIVEDRGFRELVTGLEASYKMPSRSTITDSYIPHKYEQKKQELKVLFAKTDSISITTDGWTAQHNETSYIGYTAHFITNDWKLRSCLLECSQYDDTHTAQHLRDELLRIANDWDISHKIYSVTTDNASNVKAAVRLTEWSHIGCFAHTVNLVVQSGLNTPHVNPLRQKVKTIVEHFHRSTKANNKFISMQNQMDKETAPLKLKNDVVTRWNSTYYMFERAIKTREPLTATISILNCPVDLLSESEWAVLQEICAILKPFEQVSTEMSAEKSVTLSKVIIIIKGLKSALHKIKQSSTSPQANALIVHYEKGILERFPNIESNYLMVKCAMLDPRFKTKVLSSELNVNMHKERLEKEVTAMVVLEQDHHHDNNNTQTPAVSLPPEEGQEDLVWGDFDKSEATRRNQIDPRAVAILEVKSYFTEANLHRKEDPLQWWKERQAIYPHLAKLAKKYLCVIATSVPSERLFSKAGQLISERRSRLKGKNVQNILFLHCNYDL